MKAINIEMLEIKPMIAEEARTFGYKVPESLYSTDVGYEIIYPNGDKTWCLKEELDSIYFLLADKTGDTIKPEDINNLITDCYSVKVGTKTTNTTIVTKTGFEIHGQSACVKAENFDLTIGEQYAKPKALDQLWFAMGFILQWAKYGIDNKPEESKYPSHIQRVIKEYEELNDKIDKLNAFINDNPTFRKLDAEERNDMACQLTSMRNYSDTLLSRLTRAGVDFKELI